MLEHYISNRFYQSTPVLRFIEPREMRGKTFESFYLPLKEFHHPTATCLKVFEMATMLTLQSSPFLLNVWYWSRLAKGR